MPLPARARGRWKRRLRAARLRLCNRLGDLLWLCALIVSRGRCPERLSRRSQRLLRRSHKAKKK